ncbi:MAG: sensor histidine kinase [Gaiellales bacterium]
MTNDMGFSRWRLVFGPWPIAPVPIFVFGVISFTGRGVVIAGISASGNMDIVRYMGLLIVEGVVIMLVVVAAMMLIGGWRSNEVIVPARPRYLIACFTGSALGTAGILLLRLVNNDAVTGKGMYQNIWIAITLTAVTVMILVFAISNGVGYTRFRIREQTERLREQVDQLARQRTLIVEADERVRYEVATALHDEVQGVLLRANLRLSAIAENADAVDAEGLRVVVADLERLRGAGIRSVGRRIAPPIEAVGLVTALDDLATSYAGSIDVVINVPDGLDAGDRASAVYRIVEQALLNAAMHGRAAHVTVAIGRESDRLAVTVDDDGVGPPADRMPGTGTAIIDAWVGTFDGSWSLALRPEGGARLTASVPA